MPELTNEQIEKAACAAYVRFSHTRNDYPFNWDSLSIPARNNWKAAVVAGAPHLQYPAAPLDGDLIPRSEALAVLGPVTDEEIVGVVKAQETRYEYPRDFANLILANRRARIEPKPPSLQEQIKTILSDGWLKGDARAMAAEIVALFEKEAGK